METYLTQLFIPPHLIFWSLFFIVYGNIIYSENK